MFYRIMFFFINVYVRLICRAQVSGREHIPSKGPFLVIANHLSSVDPPLVFTLMPPSLGTVVLAAMAHRHDFFIGWMMEHIGAVWVRRGEADRQALRQALEVLKAGRPIGLSPEGTRSHTGALIKGQKGATFLAVRAGAPILPIAISGSEKVFPSLRRLRRAKIEVKIFPPFSLPPREGKSRAEHMDYCTDLMMTRLASMLPPAYRGVYANHKLIQYWEQLDAQGTFAHPDWSGLEFLESPSPD